MVKESRTLLLGTISELRTDILKGMKIGNNALGEALVDIQKELHALVEIQQETNALLSAIVSKRKVQPEKKENENEPKEANGENL